MYIDDCPGLELRWEILRADGETKLYTSVNETYRRGRYGWYPDGGLHIEGYCRSYCNADMWISPTDLRYDGAQITTILDLPGCSDSPYSSDAVLLFTTVAPSSFNRHQKLRNCSKESNKVRYG